MEKLDLDYDTFFDHIKQTYRSIPDGQQIQDKINELIEAVNKLKDQTS